MYHWQFKAKDSEWNDGTGGFLEDSLYFDGTTTDTLFVLVGENDFRFGLEYRCIVTDAIGRRAISESAHAVDVLSLLSAEIVDTDEIDREYVKAGSVFSLHCEAKGGSGEYTYEWYTVRDKDASKAERIESCYVYEEGTENFSYFANRAFLSDAVEIYCVVSDSAGAKVTTGWIKILEKTN